MDEGRGHSVCWMFVLVLGLTMICAHSSPFGPTISQIGGVQKEDILANFIKTPDDDNNLSACIALIDLKSPQLDIVDSSGIVPIMPIDPRKLAYMEEEMRKQAVLHASFEAILIEKWFSLNEEDRINSTISLEDLLRRQAISLESFQLHLKEDWCFLNSSQKQKFTSSYEDLLKRQSNLLLRFEDFLHLQQTVNHTTTLEYLSSFEDLIRREAILLDGLEDILKMKCNKLKIDKSADKCCGVKPGEPVNYTFTISNDYNSPIKNVTIIDDQLGLIVNAIELAPRETRSFSKLVYLNGSCGCTVCNRAKVFGIDSKGFFIYGVSQEVCIKITCGNFNLDTITLGAQKAEAMATDPAAANNSVEIVKNQKRNCAGDCNSFSEDRIGLGNQTAMVYSNGGVAGNHIKIESNAG